MILSFDIAKVCTKKMRLKKCRRILLFSIGSIGNSIGA